MLTGAMGSGNGAQFGSLVEGWIDLRSATAMTLQWFTGTSCGAAATPSNFLPAAQRNQLNGMTAAVGNGGGASGIGIMGAVPESGRLLAVAAGGSGPSGPADTPGGGKVRIPGLSTVTSYTGGLGGIHDSPARSITGASGGDGYIWIRRYRVIGPTRTIAVPRLPDNTPVATRALNGQFLGDSATTNAQYSVIELHHSHEHAIQSVVINGYSIQIGPSGGGAATHEARGLMQYSARFTNADNTAVFIVIRELRANIVSFVVHVGPISGPEPVTVDITFNADGEVVTRAVELGWRTVQEITPEQFWNDPNFRGWTLAPGGVNFFPTFGAIHVTSNMNLYAVFVPPLI